MIAGVDPTLQPVEGGLKEIAVHWAIIHAGVTRITYVSHLVAQRLSNLNQAPWENATPRKIVAVALIQRPVANGRKKTAVRLATGVGVMKPTCVGHLAVHLPMEHQVPWENATRQNIAKIRTPELAECGQNPTAAR